MNSVIQLSPRQRAELFVAAAQSLGISAVIIEKDFWVCWTLRELFQLPGIGEHLIFKGGTSLSKVWQLIDRFSEDIDVSLSRDWLGFTGETDPEHATGKRRRERIDDLAAACAEKVLDVILPALRARAMATLGATGWSLEIESEDPQTVLLHYPSSVEAGAAYIPRLVRIEFGARSDAWPADDRTLTPYVATAVRTIADATVAVRVLAAERTFWEKATILHAEAHRAADKQTPARYSRHYSDLAALAISAVGPSAIEQDDLRARVVEHKQVFFAAGWAQYHLAVPGSFRLLPDAYRLDMIAADYRDMREMFFTVPRTWSAIVETLLGLEARINRR